MGLINKIQASRILKKGIECFKKHAYLNAEALFSEAIKLDPDSPDAFFYRAQTLRATNRLEEAIKDCSEAIRLNPGGPIIWEFRGVLRGNNGDLDLAVDDFKMAIRLNPGNIYSHENLARTLTMLNRYDEAVTSCNRSLDLFPLEQQALRAVFLTIRADAYLKWGRHHDAIKDFDMAINLCSDKFPRFYAERGLAYQTIGNTEEAKADFKKAIELYTYQIQSKKEPEHLSELFGARGIVYSSLGLRDQAMQDLQECIRLNPPPDTLKLVETELANYDNRERWLTKRSQNVDPRHPV